MALIDDDTLLCILGSCDIDTFFVARRLSKSIHALIQNNLTLLCRNVALSSFPQQHEIFHSDSRPEDEVYDILWLKSLRFEQLAAILVECTNQNNNATHLLNAENTRGREERKRMRRAFSMLAGLHQIYVDGMLVPETELPLDNTFALPTRHRAMTRRRRRANEGEYTKCD